MGNNPADNGEGYVEVKFSVVIPEMEDVATRSMATPNIERLHLLIFDNNGLLSQRVNATLASTEWGETAEPTYFTAKLARSDYKRTIHLIANSPYTNVEQYPMATESQILTTLTVSGTQDAYWQRVVLENGITGVQKTEGTGADQVVTYEPSAEVTEALTYVPLVRNHARVSVVSGLTSSQKSFTDIQFALVDIAASGTIVPYNTTTGDFVTFTAATDYDELTNAHYEGYEPAGRQIINHTFNNGDLVFDNKGEGWVAAGGFQYLYERKQNLEPAYVLVRGKYDGASAYSYYLIDFIRNYEDGNGNPQTYSYNLLRNIAYTITITNVAGAGYDTAEQAYQAGPGNNINASIKTKNLLNVSDGTSALYVEYTQRVINETGATVTLRYKYVTDLAAHQQNPANGVASDDVTFSLGAGEVIDGAIADGDATTDSNGWNTLSFTSGSCPAKNQGVKTQTLTLNAGSFSRTVEYILVAPYTLVLDVPAKVPAELGTPVTATLTLEERLPFGIFPLEFFIVAENNSLSPDATLNTLPVVTGLNVDGTPGGQHFGYKFTLEYDQYYSLVGSKEVFTTTFPLYFKTNMANSAPEIGAVDGTDCYAYNLYHNVANDEFYNGDLYVLTLTLNPSQVVYGLNQQVTASLRLPEAIADSDWTNGQHIDFAIGDSNSTLELINVENGAQKVTIDGVTFVRVPKSVFDGGTRAFTLTFKTIAFRSATTITASNDNFRTASATLTNSGFGTLGIEVTEGATLLPGAGQTVAVAVTVPAGAEAAFENDKLELTLTTSAAYLANPETRASISGSGTIFKVVVLKDEYNNATGSTYSFDFTTTAGNTPGGRTITVSHPYDYLVKAEATTTTSKFSIDWTMPQSITNSNNSSTTSTVTINLPESAKDATYPLEFTLSLTNLSSSTYVYVNNEQITTSTSYTLTVGSYPSNGEVPFTIRAYNTSNSTKSFTIQLSSDLFETLTASYTKTSRNGNFVKQ